MTAPAMAEKLPEGKPFVAEWAFAPETGLTIALADSGKVAIEVKTPEQKYGEPAQYFLTPPAEDAR